MTASITATLLELGDATSRNLEFSHRDDVWVSYGEETITETNLLEIRRRHPERVHVHTFPKISEAKNGADWEWHIIGKKLTIKLRVQAKRLQRNDVLKITHKVKSSQKEQRVLLIDEARKEKMKAVYCVYCTERQRNIWQQPRALAGNASFHAGCLIAGAEDVPLDTKKLGDIEIKCIPWHYLFESSLFIHKKWSVIRVDDEDIVQRFRQPHRRPLVDLDGEIAEPLELSGWTAPTINDLNVGTERGFDRTGVSDTTAADLTRLEPEPETDNGQRMAREDRARLSELGIYRMLVMDVRDES